jgi:orotate phosphoribosyltransferase
MTTPSAARHPRLAAYLLEHAIKRGAFTLASGRQSSCYCDTKLASFAPEGALLIADAILDEIEGLEVAAVGGMDMGATPLAAAVALRSFQRGRPLPGFVVRKDAKGHGTRKRIEGPIPQTPSPLVIVEDVVTSGGSILQSIDEVRAAGHTVALAITVLDRMAGGAEAIQARGVKFRPLVTIAELGIGNEP